MNVDDIHTLMGSFLIADVCQRLESNPAPANSVITEVINSLVEDPSRAVALMPNRVEEIKAYTRLLGFNRYQICLALLSSVEVMLRAKVLARDDSTKRLYMLDEDSLPVDVKRIKSLLKSSSLPTAEEFKNNLDGYLQDLLRKK